MKNIDLTLTNGEIKILMKLLDDEIKRFIREDNNDWQMLSAIKDSIMVSVYEHALED